MIKRSLMLLLEYYYLIYLRSFWCQSDSQLDFCFGFIKIHVNEEDRAFLEQKRLNLVPSYCQKFDKNMNKYERLLVSD